MHNRFHPRSRQRRGLTPEELLHLAVANYLQAALRPPVWWSTIGHGSKVSHREAGMLKAKGLKPGLPDIVVIAPQPIGVATGSIVIGIELKAERGRASDNQVSTHEALTVAGARIGICRSIDHVEALLKRHGVPVHAHIMPGGGIMKVAA